MRVQRGHGAISKARARRRRQLDEDERKHKAFVRDVRDKQCRFPLCGCRREGMGFKAVLTVSHDEHKGMGGDKTGERSQAWNLLLLCKWRHQDAPVSRDRKTMRTRYLGDSGNNGPIAFDVDLAAVYPGLYGGRSGVWMEVARERACGMLDDLTGEQLIVLTDLAEMER